MKRKIRFIMVRRGLAANISFSIVVVRMGRVGQHSTSKYLTCFFMTVAYKIYLVVGYCHSLPYKIILSIIFRISIINNRQVSPFKFLLYYVIIIVWHRNYLVEQHRQKRKET